MKYKVKEDCYCEGYLHELLYPRPGLIEKKLIKGDVVKLKKKLVKFLWVLFKSN